MVQMNTHGCTLLMCDYNCMEEATKGLQTNPSPPSPVDKYQFVGPPHMILTRLKEALNI